MTSAEDITSSKHRAIRLQLSEYSQTMSTVYYRHTTGLTKDDGVDFPRYFQGGFCALKNIHGLLWICISNGQRAVVLLVFLYMNIHIHVPGSPTTSQCMHN